MKYRKLVVLLLLFPLFAFTMHKYYVSLCEIEYVEEQQSIQIVLGMFIDDIEFTLNKNHAAKLYLATPDEVSNIDKFYKKYLNEHFKIKINGKWHIFDYIGKEYDDDIVRFYLEITGIQQLNSIEITNTALFRDFERQQNIIKLKAKNYHKTFYLNRKNDKGLLNF